MTISSNTSCPTVLVLGASGMLGSVMLRFLASSPGIRVVGTVRSSASANLLAPHLQPLLVPDVDADNMDSVMQVFASVRPDVAVNCIGVVKQIAAAQDPLTVIPANALLPHRLARLCAVARARLIHISTDCVFSGSKGMYVEDDVADAKDLYGRSKHMGEVDYPHAVTLRTSIIGHELNSAHGLIEWFLSQQGFAKGYRRAIFTGLTTVELSRVIREVVIPRDDLRGVYHVAARPINKHDLLTLVAETYQKTIAITPDDTLAIDRSLNGDRFRLTTGYVAPEWPALIAGMKAFG
jgi:dTDP-4-dehydrorhamnose reductase